MRRDGWPARPTRRLLAQLRDRVGRRVTDWRPGARVLRVSPLTGGTSSLTFLVELAGVAAGETPVVLKVAPPGLAPVRNRDVLRQARLQQAVQGRPGRAAAGAGRAVLRPGRPARGPAVHGDEPGPGGVRGAGAERRRRAARARPGAGPVTSTPCRCWPSCTRIVPAAVGLGDEPVVGLADEVDRWTRAFATLPGEHGGRLPAGGQGAAGEHARAAARRRSTTATSGSGTPCARERGSTRSSTGRSGRSATRASTWPG